MDPETGDLRPYPRVRKRFTGESRTKQSFRDETDINVILARYKETGQVTHVNGKTAVYGDFSNAQDLLSSLNSMHQAQDAFDQLPAALRDKFSHSPAALLSFVDDPTNRAEAIELGLLADPNSPRPDPQAKPATKDSSPPSDPDPVTTENTSPPKDGE